MQILKLQIQDADGVGSFQGEHVYFLLFPWLLEGTPCPLGTSLQLCLAFGPCVCLYTQPYVCFPLVLQG